MSEISPVELGGGLLLAFLLVREILGFFEKWFGHAREEARAQRSENHAALKADRHELKAEINSLESKVDDCIEKAAELGKSVEVEREKLSAFKDDLVAMRAQLIPISSKLARLDERTYELGKEAGRSYTPPEGVRLLPDPGIVKRLSSRFQNFDDDGDTPVADIETGDTQSIPQEILDEISKGHGNE